MTVVVGTRVKLSAVGLVHQTSSYTGWEGTVRVSDNIGVWCEVEWDNLPGQQYAYYQTWLDVIPDLKYGGYYALPIPPGVTVAPLQGVVGTPARFYSQPGEKRPGVVCAKCQIKGKVIVKEIYEGVVTCMCKLCGKEYQET